MTTEPIIRDEKYMRRAIELAVNGRGSVSPNPLVGCVVTDGDLIIGEGWHMKFGGAHAEVNAIESVTDRSRLSSATLYVTLEPCSHHGKTPPCADLIIAMGIKKVVIGNVDPNPLVSGKGIAKLRAAGIDVVTGILEKECRMMNRRFLVFMEKKRPYIILKWAQTSDGFIARSDFSSKWISNPFSRTLVHKWRSEEDAVLVGRNTAACDDPMLTVRHWPGRNPKRIVIDRALRLPPTLRLFDGQVPTICYNLTKNATGPNVEFVRLPATGFLQSLVEDLHSRQIQSVFIEGGAAVLNAFIAEDLWDEARVFHAPSTFGAGIQAPTLHAEVYSVDRVQSDELRCYYRAAT